MLCYRQVLIPWCILFQFFFGEIRHSLAVHWNDLILLVKELDVLYLPLVVLHPAEDESAVAVNVDRDTLQNESLSDCSLHFADASIFAEIDIGEGAVFPVRDEVAVGAAFHRDINELVNWESARPSCAFMLMDELC